MSDTSASTAPRGPWKSGRNARFVGTDVDSITMYKYVEEMPCDFALSVYRMWQALYVLRLTQDAETWIYDDAISVKLPRPLCLAVEQLWIVMRENQKNLAGLEVWSSDGCIHIWSD